MSDTQAQDSSLELDKRKIDAAVDRHKATLDFWKFISGSVFAAIIIAIVPPLFQYATSILESTRLDNEQKIKHQQYKDQYIQNFLQNGISQDIELRVRFAHYFALVSTPESRPGWENYYKALIDQRSEARAKIDTMEAEWRKAVEANPIDNTKIEKLERNLKWLYNEIGYAEKNRSAASNPRVAESLPALPANGSVVPSDYQVFVQFAGVIVRDDVKNMMRKLNDVGWKMRGVELGGQRTTEAAGENEVRYSDKGDAPAAEALAQAVQAFNLVSGAITTEHVPNLPKGNNIPKGNLEIWISR